MSFLLISGYMSGSGRGREDSHTRGEQRNEVVTHPGCELVQVLTPAAGIGKTSSAGGRPSGRRWRARELPSFCPAPSARLGPATIEKARDLGRRARRVSREPTVLQTIIGQVRVFPATWADARGTRSRSWLIPHMSHHAKRARRARMASAARRAIRRAHLLPSSDVQVDVLEPRVFAALQPQVDEPKDPESGKHLLVNNV